MELLTLYPTISVSSTMMNPDSIHEHLRVFKKFLDCTNLRLSEGTENRMSKESLSIPALQGPRET